VSWRAFALGLAVVLMPKWASADQCEKVIVDAAADCTELDTARSTLAAMPADEQTKDPAKVTALNEQIAALQGKPFNAYCRTLKRLKARSCDTLASTIGVDATTPLADEKFKADVNHAKVADRQTSTNKSGSSAQAEPVEPIQPISLAGGSVTLSGTRSGTKGVGTITVNPLALAVPSRADLGRVFDLSVSAPFALDSGVSQDTRYFSARLRVNATAPFSARELQLRVDNWLKEEGKYGDSLQEVLSKAPNVVVCAETVAKTHKVTKEACGQDIDTAVLEKIRKDALASIEEARRAADKYYVGLDARIDSGDPTGTIVVGDKGTHVLGGIAAGVRLQQGTSLWDWELRGRAAGDYFRSRDDAAGPSPKTIYSFDWGAAIVLSGRVNEDAKQRLAFGVGVEGRQAGDSADAKAQLAPTNYASLNLMAVVPTTDGSDLGLAVSLPVADSVVPRGAIVSLSTDLGMLDHSSSK
jgi:hypothetical protein